MEVSVRNVRESAQYIASKASSVFIDQDGVERASRQLLPNLKSVSSNPINSDPLEPKGLSEAELVDWMFMIDTLNFCFWSDTTTLFTVNYRGKNWTGYRSLCAALCRACEELHLPVYKPSFYGSISMATMRQIFRSESREQLPMMGERRKNLHQAAQVLNQYFGGSAVELVRRCGRSSQHLVQLLVDNFHSYRDISTYRGQSVSFLKRAQIFAADLWDRFGGCGFGEFNDIDTLTMFADYRVPQALLYLGVLRYNEGLMESLRAGKHLSAGGEAECEIRGCSIHAVELIKQHMEELSGDSPPSGDHVTSVQIDYYLWNYAKTHSSEMSSYPIHRTRSIFY